MKEALPKIEAVLTPEQRTKFEALRAQMRPNGGQGAPGGGGASSPASPAPAAGDASSAPAAHAPGGPGGASGGGGAGRFAMMADFLNLDADQRAKAMGFFAAAREKAEASNDPDARRNAMREAMGQLETILRPDQKAKLPELRAHMAQGGGQGGGAQQ
jgi:Spy/CpxP family protein refolding chaperone